MADVTYPKGLSKELAARLYAGGDVDVSWAEDDSFEYDEARSECMEWLRIGTKSVGGTNNRYDDPGARWPQLVNVIRRGSDNSLRVFQYSDGSVFEQET